MAVVIGVLAATAFSACTTSEALEREYLQKAQKGDLEAQYKLARLYFEGDGIYQSDKKGAYWIRQAAEHGYDKAQGDLGMMYALGTMVRQSNVEAIKWLTLCAQKDEYGPAIRYMKEMEEKMKAKDPKRAAEDIRKGRALAAAWKPKTD